MSYAREGIESGLEQVPIYSSHETLKGPLGRALEAAALSIRLALINRTLVRLPGGSAENVAEHSHSLGLIAMTIASEMTIAFGIFRLASRTSFPSVATRA